MEHGKPVMEDGVAAARTSGEHINALLHAGMRRHAEGSLAEASDMYRRVLQLQPEHPDGLHLSGLAAYQSGDLRQGLELVSRAITRHPQHASFWSNRGHMFMQAGRRREAEDDYRQSLRIRDDPAIRLQLAMLLAEQGRMADAEQACLDALHVAPGDDSAHFLLGSLLHETGRRKDAEQAYRNALRHQPAHADAYNNLGLLLEEDGRLAEAQRQFELALAVRPAFPEAHYNLGIACARSGMPAQAEASYLRALALRPDYVDALNNLANLYHRQGRVEEAAQLLRRALRTGCSVVTLTNLGAVLKTAGQLDEAGQCLRRALDIDPDHIDASINLSLILKEQRSWDEAARCLQRVLRIRPDHIDAGLGLSALLKETGRLREAEQVLRSLLIACEDKGSHAAIHHCLAILLRETGRRAEAESCVREALRLAPDDTDLLVDMLNTLGMLQKERGHAEQAAISLRQALALNPDHAGTHNHLGLLFKDSGRLDEAQRSLHRALCLAPENADALNNFGLVLQEQGRLEEAEQSLRRALLYKPGCADIRWNLGIIHLLQGRLREGWRGYECRLEAANTGVRSPRLNFPRWQGESLEGRRLLLIGEQGFGDQIQFIRYASLLGARGARVDALVSPELTRLFRSAEGVGQAFSRVPGAVSDYYDYWSLMLSVPAHMNTDMDSIPCRLPYLAADRDLVAGWRQRLDGMGKGWRKIGLAWSGRATHHNDRFRSLPLARLAPLIAIPGIAWFALQKTVPSDEAGLMERSGINMLGEQLDDFADTAAVIANLDLLISVDTSAVHLAGALDKPAWVLLPANPDWRWMRGRNDTPWYPGMRLFRQERLGQWDNVIQELLRELQA